MAQRHFGPAFTLWFIAFCSADPPDWPALWGTEASTSGEEGEPGDRWPDLGTHDPDPDAADGGVPAPPSKDLPSERAPWSLRLLGAAFDPPGADGGPESPEWIWLENLGPGPLPVSALGVQSRNWPRIDADRLDLATDAELPLGARLLIMRYASPEDLPEPEFGPLEWRVPFVHTSGLTNSEGAILVEDGAGGTADALCYGASSCDAPYVGEGGWQGSPVPSPETGALCRVPSPWLDPGLGAQAWTPCSTEPPAPE